MNKRIISLLLSVLMLAGVLLTSCSQETTSEEDVDKVNKEASSSTMTLSMYAVSEAPVSDETAAAVNEAFNRITKSKFKTQVNIHFATYDEYYDVVEGIINKNAEYEQLSVEAEKALKTAKKTAKAMGVDTDDAWLDQFYIDNPQYADFRETEALTGDDTTAEETVLVTIEGAEDFTISEIKYPEEKKNQIDIIWIDSYDRYMEYIEKEYLSRLDDEISSSSKKLKEYINPNLMAWAKWAGSGTYAIPNNTVVGEYTYLLLNKDLVDKYHYDPETLSNLTKCTDFLNDISTYEKDILPIVGELPVTQTFFWSYDFDARKINYNTFSLSGNTYNSARTLDPASTDNIVIGAKNILTVPDYVNQITSIQAFKDAGYITDDVNTDKTYALRVVKGGAELEKVYGDKFYMNVLEYPRVAEDDIFGSMFGVSSYTRSVSRSMEIITYLNTNSDLRNVLQYGVEGLHYSVKIDGTVTRLNNDYMMKLERTGNVFMAYPEEGMDPEVWTYGKKQNLESKSALINCFRVPDQYFPVEPVEGQEVEEDETPDLDIAGLEAIKKLSEEAYAAIQAAKTSEELEAVIAKYTNSSTNNALKGHMSSATETGLYFTYYTWMQDTQLYVPKD